MNLLIFIILLYFSSYNFKTRFVNFSKYLIPGNCFSLCFNFIQIVFEMFYSVSICHLYSPKL